jgi:hypothetical protein
MPYDAVSSLPAYKEGKERKDYCRQVIFLTIKKLGTVNDRQIAEYLQWPINRVTPRRGELVDNELIVMDKKDIDPVTGRTVSYWAEKPVNWQPKMF